MKTQFNIGQKVILGSSFSRRYAIGGTVTNYEYIHNIGMIIYHILGEDGKTYADTANNIIAA